MESKIISKEEKVNALKSTNQEIFEGTIRVKLENMNEDIKEGVPIYPKVDNYIILNGLKW